MNLDLHDLVLYMDKDVCEVVDTTLETGWSRDGSKQLSNKTYTVQNIKTKRIISNIDKSQLNKHPTLELLYGKNHPIPSQKV